MFKKILIILFLAAIVGARHAVPLPGLSLFSDTAFADSYTQDGKPCPPECVTDSMEIVTWYPSPYNEYEELRLYPKTDAEESLCDSSEKLGLMYYNKSQQALKVCWQDPSNLSYSWKDIALGQAGYWELSGNDIYNTNVDYVNIKKGIKFPDGTIQTTSGLPSGYFWVTNIGNAPLLMQNGAQISATCQAGSGCCWASYTGYAKNNNGTIQTRVVGGNSSNTSGSFDSGWVNGVTANGSTSGSWANPSGGGGSTTLSASAIASNQGIKLSGKTVLNGACCIGTDFYCTAETTW